jgi:Fic family protein
MNKYPYLEKYKIPHQINYTDKFIQLLMEIAEQRPFIEESLGNPLKVELLRKAKIRAITYSNQIEGNHLQEEQVTALIDGKRVKGSEEDICEVKNYYEALDYIETLAKDNRKLVLRDICDIQKLVTKGRLPDSQSGNIRSGPVSIINSETKEVIEECPPHYDLPMLMEELLNWIEDNQDRNSFALAFAAHFITVAIHPFADGNGRTVRLLQHLLLLRTNEEIARFVPSETSIMAQRDRYYFSIRQTRELKRLDPFLEYLAECFVNSSKEVVNESKKILREQASKSPEARNNKIIKFLMKNGPSSTTEIVNYFKFVPKRTIERDLHLLLKKKIIKAQGSTRSRKYFLKNSSPK